MPNIKRKRPLIRAHDDLEELDTILRRIARTWGPHGEGLIIDWVSDFAKDTLDELEEIMSWERNLRVHAYSGAKAKEAKAPPEAH